MMCLHLLETSEPAASRLAIELSPDDDPAGLVWQTQRPLVTSEVEELRRWRKLLERVGRYGAQSYC